jgi:ribosomal protein S27E
MPPPEGVRYDFKKTEQVYTKLMELVQHKFYDQKLDATVFPVYLECLTNALGGSDSVAFASLLLHYHNRTLTRELSSEIAWRVAGGLQLLSNGRFLEKGFTRYAPTWLPLRIEGCKHSRFGNKTSTEVTFRILSGCFAGLTFTQLISYKYLVNKIAKDIGFPAYKKANKNELALCWLVGLVSTDDPTRPRVEEFFASSSVLSHNRDLRKARAKPCIFGYSWLCHECTIGHSVGPANNQYLTCPRGTHQATFVEKECKKCHNQGWFDPTSSSVICLGCTERVAKSAVRSEALV